MSVKALKRQLMAAIAMVLVAAVALGSSTYAWFVNNAKVTAAKVNVTAATAYSLLISHDAGDNKTWLTTVQDLNQNATALIPSSTKGDFAAGTETSEVVTSNNLTVNDLKFVTDKTWTGNYVTAYSLVSKNDTVRVTNADGTTTNAKYMYTDTVYLKSAQDGKIYLDSTGTGIGQDVASGSGSITTYSQAFSELTNGAQKALLKTLRVGLVVTDASGEKSTFVYQLDGELSDNAVITTTNSSGVDGVSGTAGTAVGGAEATTGVPAFANLVAETVGETTVHKVPVITNCMATGSQSALASNTTGKDVLAEVEANDVIKVDIYVWMEGCDQDTVAGNIADFAGAQISNMMFGFCLGE